MSSFQKVRKQRVKEIKEYWRDGVIDEAEISKQQNVIKDQLVKIETLLDDNIHAKLTSVFIDWRLLDMSPTCNQL
jgi:hypothetical protein